MTQTVLIVPAWSDQAGQCRIVATDGDIKDALKSYRADPARWSEVGLMNSSGKVVHLSQELQDAGLLDEMRDCEPLMAGTAFQVRAAEAPAPRPRPRGA
jgi:hypothetical protein